MCRLWQLFCLLFVAAVCRGQTESQGDEGLMQLLREVRQVRRAQEELETDAVNMSEMVKEKFETLNRRLDLDTNYARKQLHGVNNLFGQFRTKICPEKSKKDTSEQVPFCPLASCYKRFRIKESSANSIEVFDSIREIPSEEGCALLCQQLNQCHAVFHNETQRLCKLLTNKHPHVEPTGRTVTIWAKRKTSLGKCPKSFKFLWRTSRYRWVRRFDTWRFASRWCIQNGGKLAELTGLSEINRVTAFYFFQSRRVSTWHVGGMQVEGVWKWFLSDIVIPTNGFHWKNGQPDNARGWEKFLYMQTERSFKFNDANEWYQAHGFLCECVEFRE